MHVTNFCLSGDNWHSHLKATEITLFTSRNTKQEIPFLLRQEQGRRTYDERQTIEKIETQKQICRVTQLN